MTTYHDLSALFQKEIEKGLEREMACSRLVTQFAKGFIDQFQWPAEQIDFLPLEGNLNVLPTGIGVHHGPGQAMHFVDGAFQVGLAVRILAPLASPPSGADPAPGIRFIRIRTPIIMRVEETHIVMNVGNQEHKVNPANAAADLQRVYETYFKNMTEYLESLGEPQKPSAFGFHVDN